MNTRELLEVLDRTKTAKRLQEVRHAPIVYPEQVWPEINWVERGMAKNRVFKKYLLLLFGTLGLLLLVFVAPLWAVYPPYGKGFLMALPPMILMASSWMAGAWWAWDKSRAIFAAVTVGGMPIRLGICLMWCFLVFQTPGLHEGMMIWAMMGSWVAFTALEIGMIQEMSKKAPATPHLEPDDVEVQERRPNQSGVA